MTRIKIPEGFMLKDGEHLAITGPNGAGKTRLANALAAMGESVGMDNVRKITFRDAFSVTGSSFYHQQRWNSQDADSAPTVREVLASLLENGSHSGGAATCADRLLDIMEVSHLLDKKIVMLSSGELRRMQLAATLACRPGTLIVDNPYVGLDTRARSMMDEVLARLAEAGGTKIVLILSDPSLIPSYITRTLEVRDMEGSKKRMSVEEAVKAVREMPLRADRWDADTVADIRNVTIRYGERVILNGLDWAVKNGERWALTGENGSGKSTLLSLVCADNPQSYACDISLFGRKRGSGESIWDIKKHIGYVSPEMFRAYLKSVPALEIVASGYSEFSGYLRTPSEAHRAGAAFWMDIFGIGHLQERKFTELSSGEQHLCLLARAFVKDPELLVLDEPMHSLDPDNVSLAKEIITAFCSRPGKTLIMVSHCPDDFPSIMDRHKTLVKHGL